MTAFYRSPVSLFFLLMMLASPLAYSQGWISTLGGSKEDIVHGVVSTSDGGCVTIGYTLSNDGDFLDGNKGDKDAFVVKYDKSGHVEWRTMIGGKAEDVASAIVNTNGGFLVTGHFFSNDGDFQGMNKGMSDIFVASMDVKGRVTWMKTYGGSGEESANCLVQTTDGMWIAAGYMASNDGDFPWMNQGDRDVCLIKIDGAGTVVWKKAIGGTDREIVTSLVPADAGGAIVTGYTMSTDGDFVYINKGMVGIYVAKVDGKGSASPVKK